ncbi:unnamed protein product [Pleuronectes platessa]|uniref:Uncharacterized protein n=1 Tax=Pleuronectes platessa TaxID=8262 RepID=A0A9N7UTF9_PLEPL|nr:unnamed protein product [Pleuronectes platessa]
MGLGWRGAAGTLRRRTEGSRYLLVTLLLLLCGFWEAHTQTEDGKSVYFWETECDTQENPDVGLQIDYLHLFVSQKQWSLGPTQLSALRNRCCVSPRSTDVTSQCTGTGQPGADSPLLAEYILHCTEAPAVKDVTLVVSGSLKITCYHSGPTGEAVQEIEGEWV